MPKKGKVLRDPRVGPGLLMAEGEQYQFALDALWKSDILPTPGQMVELDFDRQGTLIGITAIPHSLIPNKQAAGGDQASTKTGTAKLASLVAKCGLPELLAAPLLIFSWFYLTALSVHLPFAATTGLTFWQVLNCLHATQPIHVLEWENNSGTGLYAFLCVAALAGPFVHHVWNDKRAELAGLLPLSFMLVVGLLIRRSIQSSWAQTLYASNADVRIQHRETMMSAISFGLGTYVSVALTFYFAGLSAKHFLAQK
jgi:hypothetical protein